MAMLLELEEVKNYLRVDTDEEDGLITGLSQSAEKLCMDVARIESQSAEKLCMDVARIEDAEDFASLGDTAKTAVLYATAYLYEHREEADHHALTLTLRSLLFGVRKGAEGGVLRYGHFQIPAPGHGAEKDPRHGYRAGRAGYLHG